MRTCVRVFATLCTLVTIPARGAEEEPLVLEPITVTATPLEAEAGHIAQPVEVLTGEALRRRQAPTIGETLVREPGISAGDFGRGTRGPLDLARFRLRQSLHLCRVRGCERRWGGRPRG